MGSTFRAAVVMIIAADCALLQAQNLGAPPPFTFSETNIFQAFGLPALNDAAGSPAGTAAAATQVWKRAKALGLTGTSSLDAWSAAQTMMAAIAAPANPSQWTLYSGQTASGLNQLMASGSASAFRVASPSLTIDQPIEIRRSGIAVDFGSASLSGGPQGAYMVRIENAANVTVSGGNFVSGDSAILVNNCQRCSVSGAVIANLTGAGIVVTGSEGVQITQNRVSGVALAGILIHRGTTSSYVARNDITFDTGASNITAGIVISDRQVDVTGNPRTLFGPDGYWVVSEPMLNRMSPPRDNLIAFNRVLRNSANGIYSDGGVRNVITNNTIQGNAKEGLCLDDGSTANVVASNILVGNGNRWGESDAVMAKDFISAGGRNPDGTPAEKVPGISVDNALYNLIFMNNVAHNFGGGVKLVRTGYFNLIGMNSILSDNDGASATQHFFGIELGAAAGDAPSDELDFTPSHGNILFSNEIQGSNYSGIFLDPGSDQNVIQENTIEGATNWAIESAQQMTNQSVNNLTHLPSRNIGSGLDSSLVTSGQPVNDPPPPPAAPSRRRVLLLK